MIEDEVIREEMYNQLEEHYYTYSPDTPFKDIADELTRVVMNTLVMEKPDAYKLVCQWFDNRH